MLKVNPHYEKLPGSYLFAEIARRVKEYGQEHPDAQLIRLGIGDVTRPLAPAVVEAMEKAAREMGRAETFRGYGPDYGYDFLIQAILDNDYHGLGIQADEVFVSDGAKCDVSNVQELFSDDAVVAVTDPVYPVYVDSNAMAGRAGRWTGERWSDLIYLPCTEANGFVPDFPDAVPDIIYLCYPNNPTGTVLHRDALAAWVDYARRHGALIIYDAAYEAFIKDTDSEVPHSIFEIPGAEEVAVECRSFSKTAGFTGLRCAFTTIPDAVTIPGPDGSRVRLQDMWKRRQSTKYNGCPYIVQRAAEAVYSPEGQEQVRATIAAYMANAARIRSGIEGMGLSCYGGIHAPYIWVKTPDGMGSWEFFDLLLSRTSLVCTPGAGFGPSGEGYVRFTAFGSEEDTTEALERLQGLSL